MTSKTKRKIEPILYPQSYLENKIKRKWNTSELMSKSLCLMKYFPKYFQGLTIDGYSLSRYVQSRVKRLKIVKKFSSNIFCDHGYVNGDHQKIFKRLYQGFRKTLKSVPDYDDWQDLSLCMELPRAKTVDLRRYDFERLSHASDYGNIFDLCKNRELTKETKRLCGHFWSGNRFVENLRMECEICYHLIVIKKLNDSKRFLSSLKTLELLVDASGEEKRLIQLMENKKFLHHITHLIIIEMNEDFILWELLQLLINCCPQLYFLSIYCRYDISQDKMNQNLSLDCLQNLRVLNMNVYDFDILSNRIDFSPSIREVIMFLYDCFSSKPSERIFECQDFSKNAEIEERDREDWKSFERSKILDSFFEKWKKLENLKVLDLKLKLDGFPNMDFLMKMFLLPLLREKSQLETFECQFDLVNRKSEEDRFFDLDILFQGIKSLRSLKNLSVTSQDCYFIYNPQKSLFLPSLSSLNISAKKSSPKFDIFKFLNGVFHNLKTQSRNEKTSVRLSTIRLRSAQELIKLFNLVSKASQFKMLQIDIEVELYVENIDEIISNFRYPISVPNNTKLKVHLFEKDLDWNELTYKKKFSLREGPYEFPQIQSFFKKY